jgi:hypothetical protein
MDTLDVFPRIAKTPRREEEVSDGISGPHGMRDFRLDASKNKNVERERCEIAMEDARCMSKRDEGAYLVPRADKGFW